MATSFLLGNELVFDSHNMVFHDLKSGVDINLCGVKGRCMVCLITHSEQGVIPKKQLCDEVWEQFGLYVSDNNLLQTIYALRRDLKAIGATDLIITHPRLGYQINPAYLISPYLETPRENSDFLRDENLLVESSNDVLRLDVVNTCDEVETKVASRHTGLKASLTVHGKKGIIFAVTIAFVVIFSVLSICLYDDLNLEYGGSPSCTSDFFIIEKSAVPQDTLMKCQCDTKYVKEDKVDWYVCQTIK